MIFNVKFPWVRNKRRRAAMHPGNNRWMGFTLGGYFHHRATVLGWTNRSLKCYPLRQHPFSNAWLFTPELKLPEVNDKQTSSFFSKNVADWCNRYHFINLHKTPIKTCRGVHAQSRTDSPGHLTCPLRRRQKKNMLTPTCYRMLFQFIKTAVMLQLLRHILNLCLLLAVVILLIIGIKIEGYLPIFFYCFHGTGYCKTHWAFKNQY